MSVASNVVKITAKTSLKGNYIKVLINSAVLIFSFIFNYYISSLVYLFAGKIITDIFNMLFFVFIIFPLIIGIFRYFWRLIFNCADNPITVFYYFSSKSLYFKTIKLLLSVIIKLLPIAILIFLPAIFVWLLSKNWIFDLFNISIPLWSRNLEYAIAFTNTLSTVIVSLISLRYYIAPILIVSNEDMNIKEAMNLSIIISKKSALDFIYLIFSFLGYIILSVFAIPLLFTIPYFLTAYVVHARFVIAEYNNLVENLKNEEYPSFTVGGSV